MGVSIGASGTCLAQQHLRNSLAYLDVPTLGQPEIFIQAREGLFDEAGNIGEGSRAFLEAWLVRYLTWIDVHAARAYPAPAVPQLLAMRLPASG